MESKELISSYDEINDTFVAKVCGKDGYCANYELSQGIFLNVDGNSLPSSIQINSASDVLNVSKDLLEDPDVCILIKCNGDMIDFELSISSKKVYANTFFNTFDVSKFNYKIRTN